MENLSASLLVPFLYETIRPDFKNVFLSIMSHNYESWATRPRIIRSVSRTYIKWRADWSWAGEYFHFPVWSLFLWLALEMNLWSWEFYSTGRLKIRVLRQFHINPGTKTKMKVVHKYRTGGIKSGFNRSTRMYMTTTRINLIRSTLGIFGRAKYSAFLNSPFRGGNIINI